MMSGRLKYLSYILVVLVMILITTWAVPLLGVMRDRSDAYLAVQAEQQLHDAIKQCYAKEHAYPINLDYLQTQYGLVLNDDRYFYFFEYQSIDLYPVVEVIRR